MKYIKKFTNFIIENETSDYEPPKYLVKPAKGDKGFYLVKKAFDNQEKYFEPSIKSNP